MLSEIADQIPLTVPEDMRAIYSENYNSITTNERLFLFAADQKIEHLNKDFYGEDIPPEAAGPNHLFEIANKARIGAFATHLGLIARYASDYGNVRYVVKLNGKTNLIPTKQADPISSCLTTVDEVVEFKKDSGLDIVGVGATIYPGSAYEAQMISFASHIIYQAHQNGLLAILWVYPRGSAIKNELHPDLIAGAAGIATSLGADFVKVNLPEAADGFESATVLKQAVAAAGNTGVICSGGRKRDEKSFLQDLYHQIHVGGSVGIAIGRNVFQKNVQHAIKFCSAVAALVLDDVDVQTAEKFLK